MRRKWNQIGHMLSIAEVEFGRNGDRLKIVWCGDVLSAACIPRGIKGREDDDDDEEEEEEEEEDVHGLAFIPTVFPRCHRSVYYYHRSV